MIYALVGADRDRARPRLLGRYLRMREERHYVVWIVVVVLGLGAAAPRTVQHPPAVLVGGLQGRFEGVPAQQ